MSDSLEANNVVGVPPLVPPEVVVGIPPSTAQDALGASRSFAFKDFWLFLISTALMRKARLDSERYRGRLLHYPSPREYARSRGFDNAKHMQAYADAQRRALEEAQPAQQ